MKIQYMSDPHLEFSDNSRWMKHNELPVTGDVLVLAGDIFYLKNKVAPLANFWKWASANYRQVLIVPGNHEYYNYCDVMNKGLQWNWMFKNNVGYYQNQVVGRSTDCVCALVRGELVRRIRHGLHLVLPRQTLCDTRNRGYG